MAEEIFIPKFGQTVEEVTLVKWLVKDGDKIIQGQEILEVETDKAIFTVEAVAKGWIHIGSFHEGQVIPVLTVVAVIGKQYEKFETPNQTELTNNLMLPIIENLEMTKIQTSGIQHNDGRIFVSPRAKMIAFEKKIDLGEVKASGFGGERIVERDIINYIAHHPKVTPLAQRMAAESGVNLTNVAGSGPNGRIIKDDVVNLIQKNTGAASSTDVNSNNFICEKIPLMGVRKIIAERMGSSVHTTARVTMISEIDATEFVKTRSRLKDKVEKDWGFAPGYNDLLARIVVAALRQCPYMNARLTSEIIELLQDINLGIAVDTDRGLLVPVIRNADKKNLRQFGKELREMVDRARTGRSLPDDLTGGTFTITNLGNYDIDAFTPVINLPEAAILGVGRIAPKVVSYNNEIVIRDMMTLSLAFDHRLIDGAPAAHFLQTVKKIVEEPVLLLAS